MVSKAVRLAVILGAIATSPLLAQQTASQLANLRHWSGQGVAPVYEGFDINPDGSLNMWVGFGERSVDDMLQVWLDMVYLDEAEYQRLVEERKAKPASSSTAQPHPQP
jgi:hypothetical protein